GCRKTDARGGVLEDVTKLPAVQLGVRRHRREPAMPDAMNGLDVFDAILGDNRDTIPGLEAEGVECAGKPRGAFGEGAVVLDYARAVAHGRKAGMTQACA